MAALARPTITGRATRAPPAAATSGTAQIPHVPPTLRWKRTSRPSGATAGANSPEAASRRSGGVRPSTAARQSASRPSSDVK